MKLFISIICIFLFPVICPAHGVYGKIDIGGISVTAFYNDGEPISYAETKVMAPDADIPFSSGWTDRNGRFCFYPDIKGEYTVIIHDGMGHRLEMKVPENRLSETEDEKGDAPADSRIERRRFDKMLLSVSVLFFTFGVFFWWKGNRLVKNE